MNAVELAKLLSHRAAELCRDTEGKATWYLFGSVLKDIEAALDVDLLIVYEDEMDDVRIRQGLRGLCAELPLHLLLMSRDEEQELNFVATQRCQRVFPIPS